MAFEVEPGFVVGDGKLSLVAGPCVIESRELVQEGARELHGICGRLDVPLLEILAEVRETFDVPVITDVHDVLHIAAVAEAVDVIQIPAFLCRQTDPMAAAGASGRAVNVKKGSSWPPRT